MQAVDFFHFLDYLLIVLNGIEIRFFSPRLIRRKAFNRTKWN